MKLPTSHHGRIALRINHRINELLCVPFYIVSYYINWVTTSWTQCTCSGSTWTRTPYWRMFCTPEFTPGKICPWIPLQNNGNSTLIWQIKNIGSPRSSYPSYTLIYSIKWVTTSWTYSTVHQVIMSTIIISFSDPAQSVIFKRMTSGSIFLIFTAIVSI